MNYSNMNFKDRAYGIERKVTAAFLCGHQQLFAVHELVLVLFYYQGEAVWKWHNPIEASVGNIGKDARWRQLYEGVH